MQLNRKSKQSYLHNVIEGLNSGLPRTTPDRRRVENLNQAPPDFKSIALHHSATPSPADRKILQKFPSVSEF